MVIMSLLLSLMDESIVNSAMSLKFVSYNCHGFNDAKHVYLSKLLECCDILFLQEHWLSESQLDGLSDVSCTQFASGISGFGCSDVPKGRPYGGCAIFWRRSLKFEIRPVMAGSRRVCTLLFSCAEHKLLCINAYMPFADDATR